MRKHSLTEGELGHLQDMRESQVCSFSEQQKIKFCPQTLASAQVKQRVIPQLQDFVSKSHRQNCPPTMWRLMRTHSTHISFLS